MLLASWYLKYFLKRFRTLIPEVLRSFGQMASKLPIVKVGGLTKKSAIWPQPHSNQSARVRGGLGSNHSQTLMADNFAAFWSIDPTFSALKDLNLFKIVQKVQEASRILRVGFALSKWPRLHRAYVGKLWAQLYMRDLTSFQSIIALLQTLTVEKNEWFTLFI